MPLTREQLQQVLQSQAATSGAAGASAQDAYLQGARGFDAQAGLNRYAQGAWGSISTALNKRLQDLAGGASRGGRMQSGFFDEDQGLLVRQSLDDFGNRIAQQSVAAQGQELENRAGLERFGEAESERASGLYGDLYTESENDYRDERAYQRSRKRGIGSAIGGVLGAGTGAFFGGPAGAQVGLAAGSGIGGMF